MIKREKLIYSFFLIVTVALASTVAFLYVNLRNSQGSLERELAREMSQKAYTISLDIEKLVGRFYDCYWNIQDDDYQFAHGYISNVTRDALYYRTLDAYFGSYFPQFYGETVKDDLSSLFYFYPEPTYEVYHNISNSVQYALDQIDFATLARTQNDSHQLIGELYYVLGINQETQSGNWTALRGISEPFSEMCIYWERQSGSLSGTSATQPNVMFGWALGNATQLYQDLVVWHNHNPRPPWPAQ
jgi:hypothetical protein